MKMLRIEIPQSVGRDISNGSEKVCVTSLCSCYRTSGDLVFETAQSSEWLLCSFIKAVSRSSLLTPWCSFNFKNAFYLWARCHPLQTIFNEHSGQSVQEGTSSLKLRSDFFCIGIEHFFQWFPNHRGLVAGIVVAGYGSGSLIFNQIQTLYINPDNFAPKGPKEAK